VPVSHPLQALGRDRECVLPGGLVQLAVLAADDTGMVRSERLITEAELDADEGEENVP